MKKNVRKYEHYDEMLPKPNQPGQLYQPVITTRIYVLHKITIALKFMSYINSDLPIPAKKLQTPG